jgi:uncharacterized membrane protein
VKKKARNAALLIGIGLGALLDGILFERILNWRSPAATAAWFPILAWLLTLAGVFILWSALDDPRPLSGARAFPAYLLMGWGGFNVLEGAIERSMVLIAAGVVLAVAGAALRLVSVRREASRIP